MLNQERVVPLNDFSNSASSRLDEVARERTWASVFQMEDARKLVLFRLWKLDRSLQGLLKSLAHLALPHELMEGERRVGELQVPMNP